MVDLHLVIKPDVKDPWIDSFEYTEILFLIS